MTTTQETIRNLKMWGLIDAVQLIGRQQRRIEDLEEKLMAKGETNHLKAWNRKRKKERGKAIAKAHKVSGFRAKPQIVSGGLPSLGKGGR